MNLFEDVIDYGVARRKNGDVYSGIENMILYGTGKSSILASLSEYSDNHVLAISPAGTSSMLEESYEKFHCYNVNNLKEAEDVLDEVIKETSIISKLKRAIMLKDDSMINLAKKSLRDKYSRYEHYAITGEYPLAAIGIEECSTISNWIEQAIAEEMGLDNLGENKQNRGMDWNILKKRTWDFYSKALRIPVPTILACNTIEAKEKKDATRRVPNLCSGSAREMIFENVANILYSYIDNSGEFKVQILEDDSTYCKHKLTPPYSNIEIDKIIDINKYPQKLFMYTDNIKEKVKEEVSARKEKNRLTEK